MSKKNGFSLVELVVVIVILGVVSVCAIGGVYKYINKSRHNSDINNIRAMEDALNSNLQGYRFPANGIPYAHYCRCSSGNLFSQSFTFASNETQTVNKNPYGSGTILGLPNGTKVDKTDFEKAIIKALKGLNSGNGKPLIDMKTGNNYFIIIYVDKYGYFEMAKLGLYEFKTSWDVYMAGLISYYSPTDYSCWSNLVTNAKKYIIYDGQINKFENK